MLDNDAPGGDETATGPQAGDTEQVADKPAAKKTAKKAAKKTAKKAAAKKTTAKKAARKSATKTAAAQPEPLPLDGVDATTSTDAATPTSPTPATATGSGSTSTTGTGSDSATATGPGSTSGSAAGAATATGSGSSSGSATTSGSAADSGQATLSAEPAPQPTRTRSRASSRAAGPPTPVTDQPAPAAGDGASGEADTAAGDGDAAAGGRRRTRSGTRSRRGQDTTDQPSAGPTAAEEPDVSATGTAAGRAAQARRRGSASRAAGPPEPVDDPLSNVFLPPRPVTPAPATETEDTTETTDATAAADDDAADAKPARTARKRGGRKTAASKSAAEATTTDDTPATEAPEVDDDTADTEADADADVEDDEDRPRRRRRRGGRGRRRRGGQRDGDADASDDSDDDTGDAESSDGADSADSADEASDDSGDGDEPRAGSRRRRRRRRRGGGSDSEPSPDDPPNTVVKVREPRESDPNDEVTALKGSTRLEAKRQRRREGRDPNRRRAPVLTESEFLARREAVERVMVVRQIGDRTQIAILEDGVLVEHYVERGSGGSYVGNVYLGRVQNVLPSMEAAFIDIGRGRNAVLYAGEVNFAGFDLGNQPKRIESVLKSGQSVLVQVTKGPVGQKGARLTSQIGLPGRYLVYSPEGASAGISRKLPDKERERLKSVLKKTLPENGGVIVRTAAEGASEDELSRDVNRLAEQWQTIQSKAKSASAPSLLYEEPDLTVRVIRDAFNEDFAKLVVAGDDSWAMIEPYVQHVAPHLAERVEKWTDSKDVFSSYRIDEQLAKALDRKVFLPSGGSLVIDRTEAMTVIDVNTGKFTGQGGNLEETVTRNNLEAAEEIVRQLRLRDIGGIVVVDFIDMVLESNRDLVLRRLVECLARDRTRHQVAEVTSLGLVQMTRKRIGQGLLEAFSKPCDCCDGRGLHVSMEPVEPEQRGGGNRGGNRGGKGKKQSQNQPKERSDAPEKIAAIAAASG